MALMIKNSQALTQGQNVALRDLSLLRCIQTHTNLWNWRYACMCLEKKKPRVSNLVLPCKIKKKKGGRGEKETLVNVKGGLNILSIYSSCLKPTLGTRQ